MRIRWLAFGCLAACGRLGFDGAPDATMADAPVGSFEPPVPVVPLASPADDDDPTLTADLLEIYFETTRNSAFDIFMSKRPSVDAPWFTPTLATELDSTSGEACPEVSGDGLTIMFSSVRPGGLGGYDLYVSTRPSRASAWGAPVAIPELNSSSNEFCAVVSGSGFELLFHSDRPGGAGARDLYRAVRPEVTARWGTPVRISELDTPGNDESAFLLPGALQLMFGSDVAGNRDIYLTTRAAVGQPFSPPVPVGGLNTSADESDPWLSPDGHLMVFATNRGGNSEIYQASR
jgi:Tol biopolymer transport system component